jgi:hypothetical protein
MHIGSGPGVAGLSGMQVQPFLPARKVAIVPSAFGSTIAASWAIEAGAADIALSTGSLLLAALAVAVLFAAAEFAVLSVLLQAARTMQPAPATNATPTNILLLEHFMLASIKRPETPPYYKL